MRAIDPRLLRRARSSSGLLLVCVVIGLAIAACVLGQAVTLAIAISRVFLGGADFHGISRLLVLLAGLTVMRAALAYLQETAAARASAVVKSQLRQGLMRRVVDAGPSWLSDHRTGEITQLATRGVDALDPYFARYLPQVVLTAIISPLFVVVVWATDWISGVVLVLTLPIVLLFMVLAGLSAQRRTDDQWRTLARMSNHFLDVVDGLTTLRVFGRARAQRRAVAIGDARVSPNHHGGAAAVVPLVVRARAVCEPVGGDRGRSGRAASHRRQHRVGGRADRPAARPRSLPATANAWRQLSRCRRGSVGEREDPGSPR